MPTITKKRGDQVKITVTLRNTGNVTHTFPVGASIVAPNGYVTDLPFQTRSIAPQQDATITFYETLGSATGIGSHTIHVAAWTSIENGKGVGELARNSSWTISVQAELPSASLDVSVT